MENFSFSTEVIIYLDNDEMEQERDKEGFTISINVDLWIFWSTLGVVMVTATVILLNIYYTL